MTGVRRVVVTGTGAVSPFGVGVEPLLDGIAGGRSMLGPPCLMADPARLPWPVGEASGIPAAEDGPPRLLSMATVAIDEALRQAGLDGGDPGTVLVVGTTRGFRPAPDWVVGGRLPVPAPADHGRGRATLGERLAAHLGIEAAVTINTACSSGANAVAHGWQLIATGRAERAVCVGVDELSVGQVLAFVSMKALSAEPCEPFGRSDGTSFGEGAGVVVLESEAGARQRGAEPIAHLWSCGQSCDAFHIIHPDMTGAGVQLAITRALTAAGVGPEAVGTVGAHGTGTRANDEMESLVYKERFGEDVPVLATKGLHGHLSAASALVELIPLLEHRRRRFAPAPASWVGRPPPSEPRGAVLKSAFAAGGLNTVVLASPEACPAARQLEVVRAVAGVVRTGSAWLDGDALAPTALDVSQATWRRLDLLGKLTTAAAALLLTHLPDDVGLDDVGLSYATSVGPALSWLWASAQRMAGRPLNPAMVPRLSYNAAPSAAAQLLHLRGPNVTHPWGTLGGLDALVHARSALELGLARAMLVVAADEYTGRAVDDDGLSRHSQLPSGDEAFDALHDALGRPRARPAVAGILLLAGGGPDGAVVDDDAGARAAAGVEVDVLQAAAPLVHVIAALGVPGA